MLLEITEATERTQSFHLFDARTPPTSVCYIAHMSAWWRPKRRIGWFGSGAPDRGVNLDDLVPRVGSSPRDSGFLPVCSEQCPNPSYTRSHPHTALPSPTTAGLWKPAATVKTGVHSEGGQQSFLKEPLNYLPVEVNF